jgi:predicted short-subunit dehydrogenase-like oxidoreductase (DUF2520 family)
MKHRTITVIGPGRVGRSLITVINTLQGYSLSEVLTRESYTAAQPADIYAITTPDSAIGDVAQALSRVIPPGATVFHCSGAQDCNVLSPCKERGAHIAALHPVQTFSGSLLLEETPWRCAVTYDGDRTALDVLLPFFTACGATPIPFPEGGNRALYHAGLVFCSNYLQVCVEAGVNALSRAGFDDIAARSIIAPLSEQALKNILHAKLAEVITGPTARGDSTTTERNLRALGEHMPEGVEAYQALGRLVVHSLK